MHSSGSMHTSERSRRMNLALSYSSFWGSLRTRGPVLLSFLAGVFISQLFLRPGVHAPGVSLPLPVTAHYSTLPVNPARLEAAKASLKRITDSYTVISETVVYSKYARMYNRVVRNPGNQGVFDYDVLGRVWKGNSFTVVSLIPFDPRTGTFTVLKEYNIAHGRAVFTFPQGCYQPGKHASPRDAALAELDEEAGLTCDKGSLFSLLESEQGSPQDKYQREVVHYFLCTKSTRLESSLRRSQDREEHIFVQEGVSPAELKAFIRLGMLQSNNIAGGLLAIDRLKQLGLLPLGS